MTDSISANASTPWFGGTIGQKDGVVIRAPLVDLSTVPLQSGGLTDIDAETLADLSIGLTDRLMAMRHNLSIRGVQSRVAVLFEKLLRGEDAELRSSTGSNVYNLRVRVVFEAVRRGIITKEYVLAKDHEFKVWLCNEFDL